MEGFLGVDIGSISTKAVVIDKDKNILAKKYIWTEGDPINAVKRLLAEIESQVKNKDINIVGTGTTGSARELIGSILNATIIKNEITANAIGTLASHPDVRTIFEIGGQDSKIIILNNGVVVDYAMNSICSAGTGAFLSSQARRLSIPIEDFGEYALRAKLPTKIAGRCTVFSESDMIHKAQIGHTKEDIIAGLCRAIVNNYLNNVGKGKDIQPPVVFQGGVSKNIGVVEAFEEITGHKIIVDEYGHLTGAFGTAILALKNPVRREFSFGVRDVKFETRGLNCGGCANNCEIVYVVKKGVFLDGWGNRCPVGLEKAKKMLI